MPQRRIVSPLFFSAASFLALVLLVVCSSLFATEANAAPLDGITGPVNEVTAPINEVTAPVGEVVEEVVPPAPTPPPAPKPPPAPPPEVQVPEAPVKVPPVRLPEAPAQVPSPPPTKVPVSPAGGSAPDAPKVVETAKNAVEGASKTATTAAGTVTSTGKEAAGTAQTAAGGINTTVRKTTESVSGGALPGASSTEATAGSRGARGMAGGSTAGARGSLGENGAAARDGAGASPAAGEAPISVLPGFPARLLRPFIYVWPAVALITEGPLGTSLATFVGHWSRSVLALFEEHGTGSLRGEESSASALASGAAASHPDDQPPFSWLSLPSIPPFNWIGSEAALPAFVFFLLLAAAALAIVLAMRHELGAPLVPRRMRRWLR